MSAPAVGELTGANPVDRGKPGSKYHLVIDANGIPLAVGLSAANTHDSQLLEHWWMPSRRSSGHAVGPGGHVDAQPSCTPTRATTI